MKSIEYVMRIPYVNYDTPAKLRGLIGFCKKAGINELQLVPVNYNKYGVFPARATIAACCREHAGIIRRLTGQGIKVGYCVLRTFYGAAVDGRDTIGFKQGRVDMVGEVSKLNPCPLDAVYLDYIKYYYAELARTGPATMLVDDDFRYEYLRMGPTCFCPLHLKEFIRRYGHNLQREALRKILERAAPSRVKDDWMEFKRVLLLELAGELRKTVHAVNPEIRMGLMLTSTEISALEGRDHRELVEAFAGGLQPLVRPGQGCYGDYERRTILNGLTDTVYQSSLMSADTEVQAEVDLYPHSLFNKSAQFAFDYQIKANLACNIKKINIWPFNGDHDVTEKHPYAAIMARNNKTLNRIVRAMPERAIMRGVKVIYSQKAARLRSHRKQDVKGYMSPIPPLLWRLGIPFTFQESDTVILTKDSFPMPREKLMEILDGKNILIDSDALAALIGLGLARTLGVSIKGQLTPVECVEEAFLRDPRNGAAAGRTISARSMGGAVKLRPVARRWKKMSCLLNLKGVCGAPGMLVAEKSSRRMAVCAGPLKENGWARENKQAQLQGVLAWLNGGVLPAVVRDMPDVCPVVLDDPSTHARVLSLINVSTACAQDFQVELEAARPLSGYRVCFINDDGAIKKAPVGYIRKHAGSLCINIAGALKLQPFQVRFLMIDVSDKL